MAWTCMAIRKKPKPNTAGFDPNPHTNPCSWAAWHMSNKSTKPGLTNWVHSRFTAILQPFYSCCSKLHQKHPKAPISSRSRTPISQETQGCLLSCRVSFLLRILLLQSQSCEAVQYPGQRVEGHRKNLQSCMTVTEKVIQIGTAWYACIIEV